MSRKPAPQDQTSDRHVTTRRMVLAAGVLFLPRRARADCPSTRILFVCPAGTVKSAIAREVLKARAKALALPVEVRSRGLKVEDHVSPDLEARLERDGVDVKAQPAQAFTPTDAAWADVLIAFDAAATSPGLSRARAWSTPSWNADYDRAKADLDERLGALLTELSSRPCRPLNR